MPGTYQLVNKCYLLVVQSLSCVWLFATPWTAAFQASLSFAISRSLFKLMSIQSVMPSNHLTLCCPLLLPPSIYSSIRVFSNESILHIRWPKYWSFSFSISPSNEYSGLISFRIDWFDFLAVQVTLKSLQTYRSSLIYRFWLTFLVIYLLKELDCLSYRVSHSLDFADCISISVSMFLCLLYCL